MCHLGYCAWLSNLYNKRHVLEIVCCGEAKAEHEGVASLVGVCSSSHLLAMNCGRGSGLTLTYTRLRPLVRTQKIPLHNKWGQLKWLS